LLVEVELVAQQVLKCEDLAKVYFYKSTKGLQPKILHQCINAKVSNGIYASATPRFRVWLHFGAKT